MNNPATRGQRPMPITMDIPVRPKEQATVPKKTRPPHTSISARPWLRWWPLFLLIVVGIVIYALYYSPRSAFSDPLALSFRLSGNFGELRNNHFHMGLDVRTNGEENLPVYAVADGYVSRIIIEEYALGKAIFITHPNGYTTVYAHLNRFYEPLEAAVEAQQQAGQKREQDISFAAGRFPVTKGQEIALSGNTGGSEAPHLHFELRDTRTGNNLNPLLYGFEMADDQPPVLKGLYWYNRQYSTYRSPGNSISLQWTGGAWHATRKVVKVRSPRISLGIRAEDKSNDSRFQFAIYRTELRLDDKLIHESTLDNFSYTDSRYINACVDYPKWMRTGLYVQHLGVLPGNHLPAWKGSGLLDLSDGRVHRINIRLFDVSNNMTTFENEVQYSGAVETPQPLLPGTKVLLPGIENTVTGNNCKVYFSKTAFYDTVFFNLKEQSNTGAHKASPLVSLHNASIPVHDNYRISLKALPFVTERLRKRVVMQLNNGKKKSASKGTWKDNWLTASFNTLGTVQLLLDTIPPTIRLVNWQSGQSFTTDDIELKLLCSDETDGVTSFRAELDGQWLLFDRKGNDFTLAIPGKCRPGKHQLAVAITDVAGNTTQQTFSFVKQ